MLHWLLPPEMKVRGIIDWLTWSVVNLDASFAALDVVPLVLHVGEFELRKSSNIITS
jgi:hypothetical protein